jgi:transposase
VTPPATLEQAIEQLEEAYDRIAGLQREIQLLHEDLRLLKQGLYGRKTERFDPAQLGLFEKGDGGAWTEVLPAPSATERSRPKPQGHGREAFPAHLPRETSEHDLCPEERDCPDCGQEMRCIGEEVTERGHLVPARMVVQRYVKKKYACPAGHAVRTAPAPAGVVDRGKFEASVYAHVATAKYCDHLPLHRLSGIFKRYGISLSKQTMWDMLVTVDELVAQPVVAQMRREILGAEQLHADELPMTVRLEGQKGVRRGYVWEWRTVRRPGEVEKVLTEFRPNRSRDGPLQFLGDWQGTLIADGYSGYDAVVERNGITRAGCWSHARRKLKEALDTGSQPAVAVLRPVQRLFWLERAMLRRAEARGLTAEELDGLRRRVRASRSAVVIEEIYARAAELWDLRSTLPKSRLGKALQYLFHQRRPLTVFLDDPRIPIHNNDTERDLRHVAVGRSNWLVFASPKGGAVASRLYSLVLSCKRAGVNPEAYLADVLKRVSTTPASEIATLTPWAWKQAQADASQP